MVAFGKENVSGGLGKGSSHMWARAYQNTNGSYGVALSADVWDNAYSAAHEIAEHRHGFRHSDLMFCEQSNLLAKWLKQLSIS